MLGIGIDGAPVTLTDTAEEVVQHLRDCGVEANLIEVASYGNRFPARAAIAPFGFGCEGIAGDADRCAG